MTTDHARPMAVAVTRMVIGGRPADAADGRTFEVVEPHRGAVVATSPLGGSAGTSIVPSRRPQAAFDGELGRRWPPRTAGGCCSASPRSFATTRTSSPALESRQIGKPISGARWEVGQVAKRARVLRAARPRSSAASTIPVTRPGLDFTLREPIGVVGLIVPWNFPVMMASWKVGPALAAGNTAILKPASYSPLTAHPARRATRSRPGCRPACSTWSPDRVPWSATAMAAHPGIGKIAFTGETATGQRDHARRRRHVKKVSLELGGKSPNIVFADADLEAFARESPYAVFDNCGQDCCARSRILVERSVHERVVELFAAATERVKVGDPSDPATEVGPLVSFRQRERVEGYVESGLAEGATLVTGGVRPSDPALADGAYLLPAVFDRVAPTCGSPARRSSGRWSAIIPFDTDEEALRIANASPYGLSGSIWSRDIGRALRAAKALKSGVVSVNCNNSVHVEAPFGGYKQSGIGKDLGIEALEQYTETQERVHRPRLSAPRRAHQGSSPGPTPRAAGTPRDRDSGCAAADPVAERVERGLERDLAPRDVGGRERPDLERLGRRPGLAADDARLERDHDHRRLEPRVEPDDLARLDEQARLLERLARSPPRRPSRRPRGTRPAAPTSPRPARCPGAAGSPRRRP